MQRVRVTIIGAGATTEWAVLPVLSGPDAASPPDSGAWWQRRPATSGDIRFQPPTQPEVVAISDPDLKRASAVAKAARVAGIYTDWRQMVREIAPDAVFWPAEDGGTKPEARPDELEVVKALSLAGVRWLWREGPPARNLVELDALGALLAARNLHFWPATPLRLAAAHRAAARLVERDTIGPVSAIQARFPFAFEAQNATYEAFDTVLSFFPSNAGAPQKILGDGQNFWLQMSSGASATLLFAPADAWNAPFPRLELIGTQGRSLVCEAGRRVGLFVPREATRWWEPPGLAPHVSAPNVAGIAEDIKAFLATCAGTAPLVGAETVLGEPGRVLALLEAAATSISSGEIQKIAARTVKAVETPPTPIVARGSENLTLELG